MIVLKMHLSLHEALEIDIPDTSYEGQQFEARFTMMERGRKGSTYHRPAETIEFRTTPGALRDAVRILNRVL